VSTPEIIQPRRNTAAGAAANNRVLYMGERGFETDTGRWKTGDGATNWNDLDYDDDPEKIAGSTAEGRAVLTGDAAAGRTALDAGLAQRARYGAATVVDGDSITIRPGTVSTWNASPGGWSMEMARLSGGRINLLHNAAVAGTGIATRLSNFSSAVAAHNPETVILSNGTNDINADMLLSDYLVNLTAYYELVRGIGAQLILGGIYPKNVDVDAISEWNAALVEWAAPRGVLVIPFWELGDPETGAWPAGWSADGVHPDYDSPAFPALGKLAWQTVERAYTEPVAATARYADDPDALMTNFFTDLTATMTGTTTITAIAATTGTLAAGFYEYRVVAATHWGNSPTYDDDSITLAVTGGVELTLGAGGTYTQRRVYRKAPGESEFHYIGKVATAGAGQTFTDGGLASGSVWRGGDTSRYPTGMIAGGWQDIQTLDYGDPIRDGAAEGIRGNIFRGARCEGSAIYRSDRFLFTGLTPGQAINVSVKCKGANSVGQDALMLRFFNPAGDTQIDTVALASTRFGTGWGLIVGRAVVPAGSDRVYVCLEGSATTPFSDWAELRVF